MGGIFPRRQATRMAALVGQQFVPGLTSVEAPPRRGKSDLLLQLFGALLKQRVVAPVLLRLGHRRLPDGAAEQVAAQVVDFAEGRLRSPFALLDRGRLAERDDLATWHDFLAACGGTPSPERFFAGLGLLAETVGPICLLLDDAPQECLRAAAATVSPALAVMAPAGPARIPEAAQSLPLEEFTVREGVLLAEGVARAHGVEFSAEAAELFVSYVGSDPFALQAVLRRAATDGLALLDAGALVRAYLAELTQGTLAAYFRAVISGEPGSPERLFALETLATGTLDAARLQRWRHRVPLEDVLEQMRRAGWTVAHSSGWVVRRWPAARDWAAVESASASGSARARGSQGAEKDRAIGLLTLRLLSDLEASARRHADDQVASRVISGLGALTPAAAAWLADNGVAGAQVPEVCSVVREEIPGGDLYLCYGFAEGRHRPESAALLAVAVAGAPSSAPALLDELNRRALAAMPPAGSGAPQFQKWLVLKDPGPADLDLAQRAGARLLPWGLFNRLISAVPEAAPAEAPPSDIVLRLPMNADYEIAAVRVLDHLLERHNCDKRAAAQARIALVEACLNAIEHGRAARLDPAQAHMEVRLSATGQTLEMVVSNPGPPFQPEEREETAGSRLHRGHGLKIIRSLTDRVSFASDLNGTSIRMSKRIPAAPAEVLAESFEDEKTAPGVQRD